MQRVLVVLEPCSIAALFFFLLWQSWLRWPDPLVDFPRDLYTAWRMSEGDLLYRDIACWYGPFSLLVETAAFKIFGVGLDTVVWLNLVVIGAALWLIRGILWEIGNRLMVWLGSVVFLVVFALGQYLFLSNYTYMAPYCSQATYGFIGGLLLVVWSLLRHVRLGQARYLWLSGAGLAIAYLNKPETLLAAMGVLGFYAVVRLAIVLRERGWGVGGRPLTAVAPVAGGFAAVWLPVFIILAAQGGAAYAWSAVNWVPHSLLGFLALSTADAGDTVTTQAFAYAQWRANLASEIVASLLMATVCAVMICASWLWARSHNRRAVRVLALAALIAFTVAIAWRLTWTTWNLEFSAVSFGKITPGNFTWFNLGQAIVAPTFVGTMIVVLGTIVAAWKGGRLPERATRLALVGTAAALMLTRMVFSGNISHYGFFLEPLAALFLLELLVVEAPRRFTPGRGGPLAAAFTLLVLCGVIQLGAASHIMFAAKTYPVGEGRDRFYSFEPRLFLNGWELNSAIGAVKDHAAAARTLIALPESAALNYHLRLRNPTPYFAFLPTDLAYSGRITVQSDLQAHPPDVFVLYSRDMHEFGTRYFGEQAASGRDILQWILANYHVALRVELEHGPAPFTYDGYFMEVFVRNAAAPPKPPA